MHIEQDQQSTGPLWRSVTPRRPIREGMSVHQATEEHDDTKEEKSKVHTTSLWEHIASYTRHHLHISSHMKILYYAISMLVLSTIKYFVDLPHFEMLTGKHNFINQMFAKKSWGLTLAVFLPYRLISLLLHPRLTVGLKRLLVRAIVTTFFFLFWCRVIFPAIDDYTAICSFGNETLALTKKECLRTKGYEYDSFDVSGHSFLLTYCVFIMMDESKEILYFLDLRKLLYGKSSQDRELAGAMWPTLDGKQVKDLRVKFPKVSPFVVVSFVSMCLLALLWDFMLIVTSLYYHTFMEKLIGTVSAICTWALMYRGMFPSLFRLPMFKS